MSQLITSWLTTTNSIGGAFWDYAAGMFVQSGVLILSLLAIDLLLRKHVRATFRYWMWMLVFVKLLLPPTLSLPTGIGYWLGDHLYADSSVLERPSSTAPPEPVAALAPKHGARFAEIPPARPSATDLQPTTPAAPAVWSAPPITWRAVAFLLWLAGVAAISVFIIHRMVFVRRLIAQSEPSRNQLLEVLNQCCKEVGVRRNIGLRLSNNISGPAVCGLFKPTILIPAALVEKLSPDKLRAALIHELAHIKRGDLWINSAQTLLQIVYFYNPLVWLANAVVRRIREQAVDEMVLATLGAGANSYSNTLIDIAETAFFKTSLSLRLIGVVESKKALHRRIRHMLNRPIPKSSRVGVLGTIGILIIAAVLLPMARAENSSGDNISSPNGSEAGQSKSLHKAAEDGDLERVKSIISKGPDINENDRLGRTALHRAAYEGHADVVKLLIDCGADISTKDRNQRTPLHSAAMHGNKKTIELLLSKGADINAKDKNGSTPLFVAMTSTWAGRREVAELLVAKGAKVPALHLAAYMGDIEKVKKYLQDEIDINSQENVGGTALHLAANSGKKNIVEFLIGKGAQVDVRDVFRWTPLLYAASHNYEDIVDSLLAKGADVNAKDKYGYTLLYYAIWDVDNDAVKLLISKGADVNAKADDGYTPLIYAIWMDDKDLVELLIDKGADMNAKDEQGGTALWHAKDAGHTEIAELLRGHRAKAVAPEMSLHQASAKGDIEKVESLIAKYANVNLRDNNGQTPLHKAALRGHRDVVELLISKGADINASAEGWDATPLHCAVGNGRKEVVELLLARGAVLELKNLHGYTPLHLAVTGNRLEIAELLLDKGADIEARTNYHQTPLSHAVNRGHIDMVKLLLAKGANPQATQLGITPIGCAMRAHQEAMVKFLVTKGAKKSPVHLAAYFGELTDIEAHLKNKADIDVKDASGFTPLHCAVCGGQERIVEFLLSKRASVNAKDNRQCTPLHYASQMGRKDLVELLLAHDADVNVREIVGRNALYLAAYDGYKDIVELLYAKGADINVRHVDNETPLQVAARNGHKEVVKFLLDKDADANIKSNQGLTALDHAKQENHKEIVELLRKHRAEE